MPSIQTPATAESPAASGAGMRDRRDADPLALSLLSQLRPAAATDRLLVWRALSSRVAGVLSEKEQQALDAARTCFEDLCAADPHKSRDLALSEREYSDWYAREKSVGRRWPSVSSVRKWMGGSWGKVQNAMGHQPSLSGEARRLAAVGGAFTPDELIAQLRAARAALAIERVGPDAEPLDYVTEPEFRRWARAEMAKPSARRACPRIALQPHPFRKAFGSWAGGVITSGGGGARATAALANALARQGEDQFSESEGIAALRRVAAGCAKAGMGMNDYRRAAGKLRVAAVVSGDFTNQRLPANTVLVALFGSWPEALLAAELITEEECASRLARVTISRDDDELLGVFAEALIVLGPRACRQDFVDERKDRQAQNGGRADWPSWETLYQRFGKWDAAVERTIEARPAVLDAWEARLVEDLEVSAT